MSPGCNNCYAFQLHDQRHVAWKRGRWPDAPAQYHQPFSRVQLLPARLDQPLRWSKPRRIFVNSLSDLFHDAVPDEFIAKVFAVMAAAKTHTFQILTKRPTRMRALMASDVFENAVDRAIAALADAHGWVCLCELETWPLPNVWLGMSVEDQQRADERIPLLLQTPAAVRFLSCEPLLGPVDLVRAVNGLDWLDPASLRPGGIDWVIAGGESGPHARPMHPDWARRLRNQCQAAGVPFFFKQWGEHAPAAAPGEYLMNVDGRLAPRASTLRVMPGTDGRVQWDLIDRGHPGWARLDRPGKKAAGRELDGRTWDEMPGAAVLGAAS